MTIKTIPWGTGTGIITLTYNKASGNQTVFVSSSENNLYEQRSKTITINTTDGLPTETRTITITQKGKELGWETKDFEYTGNVQSVELPPGKYKLQCWGAQGGTSYGDPNAVGSKGGYSEGIITLTETTTLYVFVGGKGSNGSSTSLVNGGWNGGGASVGYSSYDRDEEYGQSYPASGGGATDFCTVTSSMIYSSGRTNRSSESLLSRCIVAGGGAGGSAYHKEVRSTTTSTTEETVATATCYGIDADVDDPDYDYPGHTIVDKGYFFSSGGLPTLEVGKTYVFYSTETMYYVALWGANYSHYERVDIGTPVTISYKPKTIAIGYGDLTNNAKLIVKEVITNSTTNTTTSNGQSNQSQQGGGTSGKGQYPGTQSSAGNGGNFGLGANQTTTNYRYCSGGGGGGWYGGGSSRSDSSTSDVSYSGGGSGFVNTAANSRYRPSGYIGLQLDSGTTTAGNTSHPSTSGGEETGHSGNGYARITVLS